MGSELQIRVEGSHPLAPRNDKQLAVRAKIEQLEVSLRNEIDDGTMVENIPPAGTDEGEAATNHYYGDGVYARSLLIPAGTSVVGKLHKQARICMVMQGKCTFTDEFRRKTVTAPWIGEFKGGSKTAVYAHEDTLWVAVLGTDLKDSHEIVDSLVLDNHAQYHAALEADNEPRRLT